MRFRGESSPTVTPPGGAQTIGPSVGYRPGMGDERTDRIHVPDGSSEAVVALPDGGSGPGGLLLTSAFPARTLEG